MTCCVIERCMEKKNTTCTHAKLDWIGADSDALFARCKECGAVLVTQNGFTMAIPAARPAAVVERPKAA